MLNSFPKNCSEDFWRRITAPDHPLGTLFGLRFIPYLPTDNHSLAKWISNFPQKFSDTVTTSRIAETSRVFKYSSIRSNCIKNNEIRFVAYGRANLGQHDSPLPGVYRHATCYCFGNYELLHESDVTSQTQQRTQDESANITSRRLNSVRHAQHKHKAICPSSSHYHPHYTVPMLEFV